MDIELQPGRYVVAVSGGVDSVALLHILAQTQLTSQQANEFQSSSARTRQPSNVPTYQLVVAHFDHGIRPDSGDDRRFVQRLAQSYGLPFVYQTASLGAGTSEAMAREKRYEFLHTVRRASQADAVITAHHQDDVLETAILNMLRGTGRRGLGSLESTHTVRRPLLSVPKQDLIRYAAGQQLQWHEDATNSDEKYTRNYIRRRILPRLSATDKLALLQLIAQEASCNQILQHELTNLLHGQPATSQLDRTAFIMLPHAVAREVMAEWLLQRAGTQLSRQLVERLVVFAKTARNGSRTDVDKRYRLLAAADTITLQPR